MMYVKIKNETLVQFPYEYQHLYEDNPYTSYDNRYDLLGWFNQTTAALLEGCSLQEVHPAPIPTEFNSETQNIRAAETPVLQNDTWILPFIIEDKTAEEIELANIAQQAAQNTTTTNSQS